MRIMKSTVAALGLAALLLVAGSARAQGPRFGMGMGMGGGAGLLGNPGVQQEIKLDAKQADEANKIAASFREKAQTARESLQGLEGDALREKAQSIQKDLAAESKKSVEGLLNSDQLKRFNQIVLQQQGMGAFDTPELQAELKITAEQKEKIQTVIREAREKMGEIFRDSGDDRAAAMQKIAPLRKESLEKVLGFLTADQKKAWTEKTGAPFEVQFRRPGN